MQSTQWDHISSEDVSHRKPNYVSLFNPDELNLRLQNEYQFLCDFLLLSERFLTVCHTSITCTTSPPRIVPVWLPQTCCSCNGETAHVEYIFNMQTWHASRNVSLKFRICLYRNFNANKHRWPTLAHQLFPDIAGSSKIFCLL